MIKKFLQWLQGLFKNKKVNKKRNNQEVPPDNIYPLW